MMKAKPTTFFSPSIHVVLCQHCGAPLEAAVTVGLMSCRFCGVQNRLAPRNMTSVAAARTTPPLPENERLARLREQDGGTKLPPDGLQPLFQGGSIPVWKVQEAMVVWQSARKELESVQDYEVSEPLMVLTRALSDVFSEQGDLMRQRGILESVLNVVTLPRHRQVMMSHLARASAKLGDLEGAEEWLRLCDPQSEDLESDSEWRAARAFIDTLSGNYLRVLQILGNTNDAVPILNALEDFCTVLRANAWEKVGQLLTAVGLLVEQIRAGHREGITCVVKAYAKWGVCSASYPVAESSSRSVVAQDQYGVDFTFSVVFSLVAWLLVFGCVVGVVYAIDNESLGWGIVSGVLLLFFAFFGVAFSYVFIDTLRKYRRKKYLFRRGVRTDAQMLGFVPTGQKVNDVPQYDVELMVLAHDRAPYATKMKLVTANPEQLSWGMRISVLVDPKDPTSVILAN